MSLSYERACRQEWFARESQHLRRSRKLKFREQRTTLLEHEPCPGGFKILRVLGKGSFGTVCLVQEQQEMVNRSLSSGLPPSEYSPYSFRDHTSYFESSRSNNAHHSARADAGQSDSQFGTIYAMKVIRKAHMIKNSQEGHIRAERDFLVASMKSPWVVDLVASFQDKANLYLVMEYMIGGDFLSLLIKYDTLNEKHTKFYIAEMIMCIEAAHRLRWIHRDVKPDNFLLSSSGHLKIADFGLAFDGHWSHDQDYYHSQRYSVLQKLEIPVIGDRYDIKLLRAKMQEPGFDDQAYLTPREREATLQHDPILGDTSGCESILDWRDKIGRRAFAKSLVGTSQYMAPEIIQCQEYDGRCDWWSVGIILYECLFGHTPFNGKDREATKAMIVSYDAYLDLPPLLEGRLYKTPSFYAMDLIHSLVTRREIRLSSHSYKRNDQNRARSNSRSGSDLSSVDLCGNFVYPDGAYEIKKHPFFSDVPWHNLHRMRPPHIPQCSNPADTINFETVTNLKRPRMSSSSSSEDDETGMTIRNIQLNINAQQLDGSRSAKGADRNNAKAKNWPSHIDLATRPRERILRDDDHRRDAIKLRKQYAFLGYTFRRPPQARLSLANVFDRV